MKILLFGPNGRLGGELARELALHHEVVGVTHTTCDVTSAGDVGEVFKQHQNVEAVINATGYTDVDKAESEEERAYLLNERAVGLLVQQTQKLGVPFFHFSSDYVFRGDKKEPYLETDTPDPINVYGASKYAGEKLALAYGKTFLIRIAWPYGEGGNSFVDKILISARDKQKLTVVTDQVGSPTNLKDAVQAVIPLLSSQKYGIYHVVNNGQASWYEFAREIIYQLGIPVIVEPMTSSALERPAQRPAYSVLANTKLPPLRHWKQALESFLQDKQLIL